MSMTLVCAPIKTTVTLDGSILRMTDKKGRERAVPLAAIQSAKLEPPHGFTRGVIRLTYNKAPGSFLGVAGMAVGFGDEELFVFQPDALEDAQRFYTCLTAALSAPPEAPAAAGQPASFVDELVKLKSLLDAGALSQEEFDAAKKKLLS